MKKRVGLQPFRNGGRGGIEPPTRGFSERINDDSPNFNSDLPGRSLRTCHNKSQQIIANPRKTPAQNEPLAAVRLTIKFNITKN